MVDIEGVALREADCGPHRSLEALRLEDPAAMCGCWSPGCAAALAWDPDHLRHLLVPIHRPLQALWLFDMLTTSLSYISYAVGCRNKLQT